jgi:ABC-type glycerol-3-phosphate transport system substrate-binding protein
MLRRAGEKTVACVNLGLELLSHGELAVAVGAVENPKESLVYGKIAYSGVPIAKDKAIQVEGWSYFIPKGSRKPELAWLFIQWAMGTKEQKEQMMVGGQSAVRAVYDDPEIKALPYVPTALYLKTRGKDVIGVREAGAKNGWGVPKTYVDAINPKNGDKSVNIYSKATFPEQEEVVEAVVLALSNALSGAMTPQAALDEAAKSIENTLSHR